MARRYEYGRSYRARPNTSKPFRWCEEKRTPCGVVSLLFPTSDIPTRDCKRALEGGHRFTYLYLLESYLSKAVGHCVYSLVARSVVARRVLLECTSFCPPVPLSERGIDILQIWCCFFLLSRQVHVIRQRLGRSNTRHRSGGVRCWVHRYSDRRPPTTAPIKWHWRLTDTCAMSGCLSQPFHGCVGLFELGRGRARRFHRGGFWFS